MHPCTRTPITHNPPMHPSIHTPPIRPYTHTPIHLVWLNVVVGGPIADVTILHLYDTNCFFRAQHDRLWNRWLQTKQEQEAKYQIQLAQVRASHYTTGKGEDRNCNWFLSLTIGRLPILIRIVVISVITVIWSIQIMCACLTGAKTDWRVVLKSCLDAWVISDCDGKIHVHPYILYCLLFWYISCMNALPSMQSILV